MTVSEEKQFTKAALQIIMEAQKQKLTFQSENSQSQNQDAKMFQSISSISSSKKILKTKGFKIKKNKKRRKKMSVGGLSQSIYSQRLQQGKKKQNLSSSQHSFYITGNFLNFNTLSCMNKQMKQTICDEGLVFPKIKKNQTFMSLQGEQFMRNKRKKRFDFITTLSQQNMNSTLNISQIGGMKINDRSMMQLLPDFNSKIATHTHTRLDLIDYQNKQYQQQYNEIKRINQNLAKRLKMLKVLEHVDNETRNVKKIQCKEAQYDELNMRQQQMEKLFCDILCEEERLRQIIVVCSKNRHQNEKWITKLNNLLDTYKKMIKIEKGQIRKILKSSKKIDQIYAKYNKILKSRNNNQRNILKQVQSQFLNQQAFDAQVMKYDYQNKDAEKAAYYKLKTKATQENKKQESGRKRLLESSTLYDDIMARHAKFKFNHQKVEPFIGSEVTKDFIHNVSYKNFINQIEKTSEFKYELQRLHSDQVKKQETLKLLQKQLLFNKMERDEKPQIEQNMAQYEAHLKEKINEVRQRNIKIKLENDCKQKDILDCRMIIHTIKKQLKQQIGFDDQSVFSRSMLTKLRFDIGEKLDFVCNNLEKEDSEKFSKGLYDMRKVFGKYIVIERNKRRLRKRQSRIKVKLKRKLTLGEQLEIIRSAKRLSPKSNLSSEQTLTNMHKYP